MVALPHERAAGLLEPLLGDRAGACAALGSSPIVNLHVLYDRPVLDSRSRPASGRRCSTCSTAPAPAARPPAASTWPCRCRAPTRDGHERRRSCASATCRRCAELLPRARGARLELLPGHAGARRHVPRGARAAARCARGPASRLPGLALAGTWTATGWPATLESAVLSGHAAPPRELSRRARGPWADAGAGAGGADERRHGVRESELLCGAAAPGGGSDRGARGAGDTPDRHGPASAPGRPPRELSLRSAGALLVLGFCGGPGRELGARRSDRRRGGLRGFRRGPRRGARSRCALRDELVMRLTGRGLKVRTRRHRVRLAPGARRAAGAAARGRGDRRGHGVGLARGRRRQRPFGVVRVVLDSPSHELMRPGGRSGRCGPPGRCAASRPPFRMGPGD